MQGLAIFDSLACCRSRTCAREGIMFGLRRNIVKCRQKFKNGITELTKNLHVDS
jgi:hypothetical protein